jgi:hypothetical protein
MMIRQLPCLGINRLVSYDSLRRASAKVDEQTAIKWL